MQAAFTALCADAQAKTRKAEDMIRVFFQMGVALNPWLPRHQLKNGDLYDGIYIYYVIYIYKYDVYIVDTVILGACDDGVYPR